MECARSAGPLGITPDQHLSAQLTLRSRGCGIPRQDVQPQICIATRDHIGWNQQTSNFGKFLLTGQGHRRPLLHSRSPLISEVRLTIAHKCKRNKDHDDWCPSADHLGSPVWVTAKCAACPRFKTAQSCAALAKGNPCISWIVHVSCYPMTQ